MFSGLEERVVDIVNSFGYLGISTLIIAETVFPPIPSEIILPLAGFTASQGDLTLPGVLLAATIGSILGALILYGFGLWIGHERLILPAGEVLPEQARRVDPMGHGAL